jgi:3',5'-cyclic AMP phosphodiesterase CpdA
MLLAACAGAPVGSRGPGQATALAPPARAPVRIAFMPDVHFHDVYAEFQDGSFPGVTNPRNGRKATIRTMQAQLTSTRLFNENHFAFRAALDDAVARGVKHIVLPGDFSDDGQPVHVRGLVRILDEYAQAHGVSFHATLGNHDPVRPGDRPGGKHDFMGHDPVTGEAGAPRAVFSRGGNADCSTPYPGAWATVGASYCTEEIRTLGHGGITAALARHGFMPRPDHLYYETPYSTYGYDGYDYTAALAQAAWDNRRHEVCASAGEPAGRVYCRTVADASYLVEPVDGVWLVGIDANVHVPTGPGRGDFSGSGNQGHDAMRLHRPHVIAWLRDVVARGEALGKQVVAFSHYPMAEFYNGASDDIAALLGADAMQLARRPSVDTTRALAATGLRLHVGGHMHVNDLSVHDFGDGGRLFNVQAPSLAAYAPAYTLLTLDGTDQVEVRTIRVDEVPRFDELFDLYRAEHALGGPARWDISILDATSYGDFTRRYLAELVRLRLLDDDWPCEMRELVKSPLSGADLLVLSQLRTAVTLEALAAGTDRAGLSPAFFDCLHDEGGDAAPGPESFAADLASAEARAQALAQANGMRLDDLAGWRALDLAVDFVRLANAGDLAFADIPGERMAQYALLAGSLQAGDARLRMHGHRASNANTAGELFQARFKPLMAIMRTLAAGAPSGHVRLDLASGEVIDLRGRASADRPAGHAAP